MNNSTIKNIPLKSIVSDPNQPRKSFEEKDLKELSQSIAEFGILQPIIVRKKDKGYMIIAGERRFRASNLIELKTIPCIVKNDYSDKQILEVQIIENLQRVDVSPIEESEAFATLLNNGFSHQDIALKVGKGIDFVYKRMKLGMLLDRFKEWLKMEKISLSLATKLSGLDLAEQNIISNVLEDDFSEWELSSLIRNQNNNFKSACFDTSKKNMKANPISCLDCPFNSKNMHGLFGNEDDNHSCNKSICFNSKQKEALNVITNSLVKQGYIIGIESNPNGYLSDSSATNYDILKGLLEFIPNVITHKFISKPLNIPTKEEFFKDYADECIEDAENDYKSITDDYNEELKEYNLIKQDENAFQIKVIDLSDLSIEDNECFAIEKQNNESVNNESNNQHISENENQIQKINAREIRKKEIEKGRCFKDIIDLSDSENCTYLTNEDELNKIEQTTFILSIIRGLDYNVGSQLSKELFQDSTNPVINFNTLYKMDLTNLLNRVMRLFTRSHITFGESHENSTSVNHGYYKALKSYDKKGVESIEFEYNNREIKREERIKERISKLK